VDGTARLGSRVLGAVLIPKNAQNVTDVLACTDVVYLRSCVIEMVAWWIKQRRIREW